MKTAEQSVEEIIDAEFITLMNGDIDLRLYATPVSIDEDQPLYQRYGLRSYIYLKRDYEIPDNAAEETAEFKAWREIDELHDKLNDVICDLEGVRSEAAAIASRLRKARKGLGDIAAAYLAEVISGADTACDDIQPTVDALESIDDDLTDHVEPSFGYFQVGIVSPTFAGVELCEKLFASLDFQGRQERPEPFSTEWQMAACQELIFHGTCAPLLDFLAVGDDDKPDKRCLDFVKQLNMTPGVYLDKQINAVGATGWDWLRGDTTGTKS